MGKASRRMNKRRQQQAAQAGQQASQELHKTLDALYEKGEYADVINTLAEIVQAKQQTAEDLYKGAYSYFMIGDYTRAAGLVTTVLNAAPDHVAARILLARVCILEDRIDDGLAIFDFIFEHYENRLTEEQARARIDSQMPMAEKRARAAHQINTMRDYGTTRRRVRGLLRDLQRRLRFE